MGGFPKFLDLKKAAGSLFQSFQTVLVLDFRSSNPESLVIS